MEFPPLLRAQFRELTSLSTDLALYSALSGSLPKLLHFFECMVEEESWAANHLEFLRLTLNGFTFQFMEGKLGEDYVLKLVKAIELHPQLFESALVRPFIFVVGGKEFPVNPLVVGVRSPYLRSLILNEYNLRHTRIELQLPPFLAGYLFNYFETADLGDSWKWSEQDLKMLLSVSEKWGITPLAKECEKLLSKYIKVEEMAEGLIEAHRKGRHILMKEHIEKFNRGFKGMQLYLPERGGLGVELFDLKEETLVKYEELKEIVTHLAFTKKLIQEPIVAEIGAKTPHLVGIDLSRVEIYSSQFLQMLPKIEELDFSFAGWLHDVEMGEVIRAAPKLKILNLSRCNQLTYRGLSEIKKLQGLEALNLSRCMVIGDRELALTVFALPQLRELSLKECKGVSDQAFHELARRCPSLQRVDLSRTSITDDALIDLSIKCRGLTHLFLNHCLLISSRGIAAVLKKSSQLVTLSVQDTSLDLFFIESLHTQFPKVELKV